MGKWKMKLVLLLTLLGTVGIIAIIPYQMTLLMNDEFYQSQALPVHVILAINTIQQVVFLFLLVLIGVRLQRRTGLSAPILEAWVSKKSLPFISKKWIATGITVTFLGSILILLLDHFVFLPAIDVPEGQIPVTTWWQGLLAMFYGGITEELLLRLFCMTFIVWLLAKVTRKEKDTIPPAYYVIGIVLATILFGIGHLPATAQVFDGLTTLLVIRGIVLNGILGLWFGYLYWKKGLEYAIIAHMSADFFIHVMFIPY